MAKITKASWPTGINPPLQKTKNDRIAACYKRMDRKTKGMDEAATSNNEGRRVLAQEGTSRIRQ